MAHLSPGNKLRQAVADHAPLQVVGTINAFTARMAKEIGHKAIYLSGGGVAANSLGLPDLGISSLEDVLTDVDRITHACDLPLLVDADTGFGGAFNIARTVRSLTRAGAAGMHIEDQVATKRCGHRPGKAIVSKEEMVDRIKASVDPSLLASLSRNIARARRASATTGASGPWKRFAVATASSRRRIPSLESSRPEATRV